MGQWKKEKITKVRGSNVKFKLWLLISLILSNSFKRSDQFCVEIYHMGRGATKDREFISTSDHVGDENKI